MPELKAANSITISEATNEITVQPKRANYAFIQALSDFPDPVSSVITLDASTLYEISGTVDIGANRIDTNGAEIMGKARGSDALVSSTSGAVLSCSGVSQNVVMRDFTIVASAGKCLNMSGPIDHQINIQYVALSGASAGDITGFDVQAVKSCFIDAANGLTFDGTTNKLFVDGTPFFGITGAAITLAATLDCSVADIRVSFFKFDSPGIGIKADTGYTVTKGVYTGNLIDGTAVPLDGLTPADVNWKMNDNTGLRDSRTAGQLSLDAPATTTISAVDTPTKIDGATTRAALTERLDGSSVDNRLQYTAVGPTLVSVQLSVNIEGGNNVNGTIMVAKNGTVIEESRLNFRLSTGADERNASTATIVELETDDYIEGWIENRSGDSNFTINSMSLVGRE